MKLSFLICLDVWELCSHDVVLEVRLVYLLLLVVIHQLIFQMHTLADRRNAPVFVHWMRWIPNLLVLETVGKFFSLVVCNRTVLAHRTLALRICHNRLSSLIQFLQLNISQEMLRTHVSRIHSIIIIGVLWALGTTTQVSVWVAQSWVLDFVSSFCKSGQTTGFSCSALCRRGIWSLMNIHIRLETPIRGHSRPNTIMDQLTLLNAFY